MAANRRPDHAQAWNNMGSVLQLQGWNEKADTCYGRALALAPQNAGIHYNRAVLLESRNMPEQALEAYEKALSLATDGLSTQIFYYLSHLRMKICDWRDYDARVEELVQRTHRHVQENQSIDLPPWTLSTFRVPESLHRAVARHRARVIRAVKLAEQPDELRCIRETLTENRDDLPLFDTGFRVRNIEAAVRRMWG